MTEKLNAGEIARAILAGEADGDLEMVYTAFKNRKEVLAQRNLHSLRVGQRVKLFGLTPKVLNGKVGEIVRLPRNGNSKRFDVKLDNEIVLRGRVTQDVGGVPVQCLEVIEG